jgi:hypothetical protein
MHPGRTWHPRQRVPTPRTTNGSAVRALIYSPDEQRVAAVEAALDGLVLLVGRSVRGVVEALIDDPPPRPQVLVVDIDLLSAGELFELHAVRDGGWCGTIITLGDVPNALRRSLGVDVALDHAFRAAALREAITNLPFDAPTQALPVLREVGFTERGNR